MNYWFIVSSSSSSSNKLDLDYWLGDIFFFNIMLMWLVMIFIRVMDKGIYCYNIIDCKSMLIRILSGYIVYECIKS